MINLIPPAARRDVKREYWIRVVSVWMCMVGTAFLMITFLKVPVYVLVDSQMNAFADSYAAAADDDVQFKESEDAIRFANETAAVLDSVHSLQYFSDLIGKLDSLAGDGVVVSSISLDREAGAVTSIVVTGEAATRIALANFKAIIENDPLFASAELPLSNLAMDVEIPFNIKITPASVTPAS